MESDKIRAWSGGLARRGWLATHAESGKVRHDLRVRKHVDHCVVGNLLLHRTHVEPVHVIPELYPVLLHLGSVHQRQQDRALARNHQPRRLHEALPRMEDTVEHALIQQEVTHPLGHNHINLFGDLDVFDLAFDDGDHVRVAVGLDVALGLERDRRGVDRVDLPRSAARREHGEHSSAAPDVEDDGVLEDLRVVEDEVAVRVGPDTVCAMQPTPRQLQPGLETKPSMMTHP